MLSLKDPPKGPPLLRIARVACRRLNLRKEPGLEYPVIGSLRRGEVVGIVEEKGLWSRVASDKSPEGWAFGQYLKEIVEDR